MPSPEMLAVDREIKPNHTEELKEKKKKKSQTNSLYFAGFVLVFLFGIRLFLVNHLDLSSSNCSFKRNGCNFMC